MLFISLCHYLTTCPSLSKASHPLSYNDESRLLIATNYDPNLANMDPWRVGRRLHSKYNKHESHSWRLYKYKVLSGQAVTFGARARKKNHRAARGRCRCPAFSRERSESPQKRAAKRVTSAASRQLHSIFLITGPFAWSDILREAARVLQEKTVIGAAWVLTCTSSLSMIS